MIGISSEGRLGKVSRHPRPDESRANNQDPYAGVRRLSREQKRGRVRQLFAQRVLGDRLPWPNRSS